MAQGSTEGPCIREIEKIVSGLSSPELSLLWALGLLDLSSILGDQSKACKACKSLETGQTCTGLEFGFGYGLKYLDCLEDLDVLYMKWNIRVIC